MSRSPLSFLTASALLFTVSPFLTSPVTANGPAAVPSTSDFLPPNITPAQLALFQQCNDYLSSSTKVRNILRKSGQYPISQIVPCTQIIEQDLKSAKEAASKGNKQAQDDIPVIQKELLNLQNEIAGKNVQSSTAPASSVIPPGFTPAQFALFNQCNDYLSSSTKVRTILRKSGQYPVSQISPCSSIIEQDLASAKEEARKGNKLAQDDVPLIQSELTNFRNEIASMQSPNNKAKVNSESEEESESEADSATPSSYLFSSSSDDSNFNPVEDDRREPEYRMRDPVQVRFDPEYIRESQQDEEDDQNGAEKLIRTTIHDLKKLIRQLKRKEGE